MILHLDGPVFSIPNYDDTVTPFARWKRGNDHVDQHTPVESVVIYDVWVVSRYQLIRSLEKMISAILRMHPYLRKSVYSVFCDDKACSVYTIVLNPDVDHDPAAEAVAYHFEESVKYHGGMPYGHNGISVCEFDDGSAYGGGCVFELDPDWDGFAV